MWAHHKLCVILSGWSDWVGLGENGEFYCNIVGLVGRVGGLNGSTPKPNVFGLVKIHPLFTHRVNEFDRICFRSVGLMDVSDI